jgi:hypothetical protein
MYGKIKFFRINYFVIISALIHGICNYRTGISMHKNIGVFDASAFGNTGYYSNGKLIQYY